MDIELSNDRLTLAPGALMSIWWSFPKAVSHTIERINHVKGIVNRNELLAQSLDVTIDCAVVDVNVIGICRIH